MATYALSQAHRDVSIDAVEIFRATVADSRGNVANGEDSC